MNEDHDIPAITVSVNNWPDPKQNDVEGTGQSFVINPGDAPIQILAQDPTRVAAWITVDGICYIGTKTGFNSQGVAGGLAASRTGSGARLLANVGPYFVGSTNEVWLAASVGIANVGVWQERKILPR